jgi:hypothetical protein
MENVNECRERERGGQGKREREEEEENMREEERIFCHSEHHYKHIEIVEIYYTNLQILNTSLFYVNI